MTEEIIIDGVKVAGCKYYLFRDKEGISSDRSCGIGLTACKGKNCDFKEIANLQRENKEKIDIIEQMIKILYPNANDDELYDVTFNGEYIDKLKELKDTADTMLMANDIKKQDIDSLREANDRLEQENKELKEKITSLESEIRQKKMTIMMNNDHYLTVDENNRKYRSALEEILESAKFAQCLPCGSGNLEDCLNCNDDTTNNGQFCMEIRIHEIKTKCVEVLKDSEC